MQIPFEAILLFSVFLAMLLLNVPVAVCLVMATYVAVQAVGELPSAYIVAQRIAGGVCSFPLLAIPFFILSGLLMGRGGMAQRLMVFADAAAGWATGGLSYVTTLTCMLFGSISGSASAAVSSIGGFMIPAMKREGYDHGFSVAVTTTAATTGLLIPPSNVMIVYAVAAGNVSVAAMFMAGVLPGITVGLAILIVCWLTALIRPSKSRQMFSLRKLLITFGGAFPTLLLMLIVIGGILSGIFSPTEASAVSVVYSLFLACFVYKQVKINELPAILFQAALTTSVVMLLIGASSAMSWFLAYENVPQSISQMLMSLSSTPVGHLLIMNATLLVVGTFMDMTPAVLIFTPIFLPIAMQIGIHPVHFGIMMIANLCIGLCTPPVGTCLFIGCGISNISIVRCVPAMVPFWTAMVVALALISFWPALSLWLPDVLHLLEN